MKYVCLFLAALCLASSLGVRPSAQDKEKEDPEKDWTWKDYAVAAELDAAEIKRLESDKVLVTNQTYKQSFQAYIGSKVPVFITSDAVLNGFHVLFEESILRLEAANARQVPPVLLKIWKGLATAGSDIKGKPELLKAAQFRAKTVIAVALKLYGEKVEFPKDIDEAAEEQVKLIVAGNSVGKPKWLGEPDAGFMAIDYVRFTPRGFYTRNETLQRHFRALSWLQAIPFRLNMDEELLSVLLIGSTVASDSGYRDHREWAAFRSVWRSYSDFLGSGDDWDLALLRYRSRLPGDLDNSGLAEQRKALLEEAEPRWLPQINDQLRFVPDDPRAAAEPSFRIISAYRLPDAVLFARTTDPRQFSRAQPTGLEVAALLGSKFAVSQLKGDDKTKLMETIEAAKPLKGERSLYAGYLDCLSALVDEPEPDAPQFLNGEAWQAKQSNALLAGWAQMRHTFALQSKMNAMYMGLAHTSPGFVEPEPEFFSKLSLLLETAETLLTNAGALQPDSAEVAQSLRDYAATIKRFKFEEGLEKAYEKMTPEDYRVFEQGLTSLMQLAKLEIAGDGDKERGKKVAATAAKAEEVATQIEAGTYKDTAALEEVMRESGADLRPQWKSLEQIVHRLESMAHKQLRKIEFSEAEQQFLKDFGEKLAAVMLYRGNSWLTPRDDSPRTVSVFSNPNAGGLLQVGMDRARAIYVLYPWKDKEVLCRGAVMPYHEFTSKEPLTDAAFKALLDSDKRPTVPEWSKKFVWDKGIGAAKFMKDH